MSPPKLYGFGPPRFEKDDRAIEFQQRKDCALFIYLAVTRQMYSRDALATLFWPDNNQKESRASLRRTLHRLRQVVGEELLAFETETVSLNPTAGLWLDVVAFQQIVAECNLPGARSGELLPGCLERLSEAVQLYTADFLAGFTLRDCPAFDDWQFFENESLRQSLSRALVQLAHGHAAQADFEPAIQYARRSLALDSLHEPAQRLLMVLYAQAGQQAAALRQYETCVQVLRNELGVDPEPETVELYERIKARELEAKRPSIGALPSPDSGVHANRLAFFSTPFVGRQSELQEVRRLLALPGCRLLTLTGPGGIGKTRLAAQTLTLLAEERHDVFPDGFFFVPLMALSSSVEIVQALVGALNLATIRIGDSAAKQLLAALRPLRALLVLDNFEHLLDEYSSGLVVDLLAAAPGLQLIITSRTRLNIQGEQLFSLAGMAVPDFASWNAEQSLEAQANDYSALQLFYKSACRVRPGFQLSSENISEVVRICQLVQGMPLGVELAAAWIEVLSPAEIAAEIECSLDFLQAEWRDLPERQRSLRAVFEASWKGLTAEEREVIQRLTVFRDGFDRQAAQQAGGAPLKLLLALVNKSWLQMEASGRFGQHELLRQYASEAFQGDIAAWQQAKDRHSSYYAAFLKQLGNSMRCPSQRQAFESVFVEFQNIRAAWLYLVEQRRYGALQEMLSGLVGFSRTGLLSTEFQQMMDAALEAFQDELDHPVCRVLVPSILAIKVWASYIHILVLDVSKWELRQAWELSGELADPASLGFAAVPLAEEYAKYIDLEQGVDRLRQLLVVYRARQDGWGQASACSALGGLLLEQNRVEAHELLLEALEFYRVFGAALEWASTLRLLGGIAKEDASYNVAARYLEEALEVAGIAGDPRGKASILWDLGSVYLHQGEFQKAFLAYEQGRQVANRAGIRHHEIFALGTYSFEAARYGDMQTAWEKRWQSLELARMIEDLNGIAWGVWELGELYRLEGDAESARQYYQKSFPLFQKAGVTLGYCFYERGLGDLALSQGNYAEARERFQASLNIAILERHLWARSYALNGLGRAALGQGQQPAALQYMQKSLKIAQQIGNPGLAMISLSSLAGLYAAAGEPARAVQLAAFVLEHYASWRETKRLAAAILIDTAASLPAEVAANAQASGQAMDLAVAIAWVNS